MLCGIGLPMCAHQHQMESFFCSLVSLSLSTWAPIPFRWYTLHALRPRDREMKCVNHNLLQHCNIHHIGNLIENVNGRLLCVSMFFVSFVARCFLCAFCKCRLPQMTIIVQHFFFFHGDETQKNTHRDTLCEHKNRLQRAHARAHGKKYVHWFFRPMIAAAVSSIAHIPIHKSSVGSINKAFNKCNFFFFFFFVLLYRLFVCFAKLLLYGGKNGMLWPER